MDAVIHFSEAHRKRLMKGFENKSETDSLFSHDMDMEFSGVRTVHVKSIKTEKLQDYNRSKSIDAGSRYGTTKEVGDEEQTFTMTQDKSLSLTIDKGNNVEQFNMKKAGEVMNAHRDEQIIPTVDTYRLAKWAAEGGIHYELPAVPDKTNIVGFIIDLHNKMLEENVPDQITLVIARTYLPALKLSDEWVGLDSLGGKTLPKGALGEFDGMPVKPVPTKRMPKNVPFMLIYKGAVIAPMKINTFKGHVDPPGLNGDLLEFRMMYDAFVLGKKAAGVAVAILPGNVAPTPDIAISDGKATITASGASAIYYTTDGSDPRYSVEAKVYTAAVTLADGDQVRAYAQTTDKYHSAVAAEDYSAT